MIRDTLDHHEKVWFVINTSVLKNSNVSLKMENFFLEIRYCLSLFDTQVGNIISS